MATNKTTLEGQIDDSAGTQECDVEALLAGFLSALLEEQQIKPKAVSPEESS